MYLKQFGFPCLVAWRQTHQVNTGANLHIVGVQGGGHPHCLAATRYAYRDRTLLFYMCCSVELRSPATGLPARPRLLDDSRPSRHAPGHTDPIDFSVGLAF